MDDKALVKSTNIVADVARDAKALLVADAALDLIAIEAMIFDLPATGKVRKVSTAAVRVKQTLDGSRIKRWLKELKYKFTPEGIAAAEKDKFEWPATFMAANFQIRDKEDLRKAIRGLIGYKWLVYDDDLDFYLSLNMFGPVTVRCIWS